MSEPKRTHLVFLGFGDPGAAKSVMTTISQARKAKQIAVDDVAMVMREPGGRTRILNDASIDPGAARGAAVGGAAGMVLAVMSGPFGLGAVLGSAAAGAVTAAVRDSGIKNSDIKKVAVFMAPGRTGLMIAMPLAEADRWDGFVAGHTEFATVDNRYTTDIVPGRTFERALDEYRDKVDSKL